MLESQLMNVGSKEQNRLNVFAKTISTGDYRGAHEIYRNHFLDIAPALKNRFQIKDPEFTAVEAGGFEHNVRIFNLRDAQYWYNSNPKVVGKNLRRYFTDVGMKIFHGNKKTKADFPEIGLIVDELSKVKPQASDIYLQLSGY